ncbi:putative monovalent cation:proton antiporter [Tripterygium wilfordii]|uniref:Putative monovalent cation:proton antiporter n=1 Tax=Tripterygium wilfordii TaxID=458696 RepID=A0A7J7CP25_TRIWF|nr:cation/H(+) antiporter 15-like [Tripterygium wilfordii]KAF5735835.1 putative monovalent cation:proton antiporter [Tripterygium wilfordii]
MGSIIMEPDDIVTYAGETASPVRNFTTICTAVGRTDSKGIFNHSNPLGYSVPLLLLELSLASLAILLISRLLRPLNQPIVVSQILGGIILGPSILSRNFTFSSTIFPLRGIILLDVLSGFGYMFYFFLIGVNMDPWVVMKINKKTSAIGFATVAVSMLLSTGWSFLMKQNVSLDPNVAKSLPVVAQMESALSFPVVAYFLSELKIINSDFGRVAMSSSMVSNLCSFFLVTTSVMLHQSPHDSYQALQTISNSIAVAVAVIFVIRPLAMWMIRHNPEGEPIRESHVIVLFAAVLVTGFCSQALGLHIYYGPLILGITIPAGPPIGSALVEKLELMTSWLFMPLFFVKNGLVINIFALRLKSYLTVQSTALMSAVGKFIGAFVASLCCRMPTIDAITLGLVLNAQGVLELGLYKMMKKNKAIDNESFVIMCTSMVLVQGAITPIIKSIYDTSRRYVVYKRRTVMHSKPNSELRVLICIHDLNKVPAAINLLEALNPTKRSPLFVYVVHLVELVGRANPLLIHHKLSKRPSSNARTSNHIVKAFRCFEQNNEGHVSVHPFTAISPTKTMHDDVCTIALDKRTHLVIVPFYKTFHSSGAIESYRRNVMMTNRKMLDKAPCSVAILVDRGLLKSSRPILESWSSYRVAILFLGGPDDREALALATRMATHRNINLTLIRLLQNGNITSDDTKERKFDNEVVSEFRTSLAGHYRVMYIEEVVMDAAGTIAVIRSIENQYELIMVGRHHDSQSPLISGLVDWNEHNELGAIGDVLASAEFLRNTTILVVQQLTNLEKESHNTHTINFRDQTTVGEETEDVPIKM